MLLDNFNGAGFLFLGVSASFLAVIVTFVNRRFVSPLAKYPGPFWASLTDLWFARLACRPDYHRRIVELHERYGPVVRVKPNKLSISSPEAFKIIYGAGNNYPKSDQYFPFRGKRPFDLFAEQNERIHGHQRRLVANAYTLETMKSLEPYVDTTVQVFLNKLETLSAAGEAVDIAYLFQLFAFDVIGEVTFGRPFGYVDAHSDFNTFATITAAVHSGFILGEVPWLYRLHQRLAPYIGNHLAVAARNGTMHDFTVREMQARQRRDGGDDDEQQQQQQQQHGDIMSKLLAAARGAKAGQLSDSDVGFMLTSNVVAGSDTTSISLSAIVGFLLRAPAALGRLQRELGARVAAGEIAAGGVVRQRVAERWPFLQAVVYEGMRLHPVMGGLLGRVVPPGGLQFDDGCFVPGGTEVGTSAWVLHLNKDIFGQDADQFRPERWLDEERKHNMHRFSFSFGGGSRTCVGKNIAMLEMSKMLPTLLLHFDLRLADPNEPPRETFDGFVSLKPFYVVARKRDILEESSGSKTEVF